MKKRYISPDMDIQQFSTRLFTALGISDGEADPEGGMETNIRRGSSNDSWEDFWDERE